MRKTPLATMMLVLAGAAHAQSLQSGTIGGMNYDLLPASGGCSAATPCNVVTYFSYQNETPDNTANDVLTYFGGAFAQANPHTIVLAPMLSQPQDSSYNLGGYNTLETPETGQMVALVKSVLAAMGNTVNPASNTASGGSIGGNATEVAVMACGPKGVDANCRGTFSAGLSFDAATYAAAGNQADIAALCGVPFMAVHGTADTNQSISYDQNLASAINADPACGNSFNLVPIQGAGHGTWSGPDGYAAGTGSGTPLGWLTGQLASGAVAAATPAATAVASMSAAQTSATGDPPVATVASPVTAQAGTTRASVAPATTPAATAIAPGQGSVTDCSGNAWTISSNNKILENGQPVVGGGDTASLTIQSCTVYGLSNGQNGSSTNWFTLSSVTPGSARTWAVSAAPSGATTVSTAAAPAQTPAQAQAVAAAMPVMTQAPVICGGAPASGTFRTVNGQILDPAGKPFIARGINVYDSLAASAVGGMTAMFPGLNFVRVGIHHPYPDPSRFQGFVTQMTGRGIVVEFEDHPDGGGGQDPAYTGSALASELAWYGSFAKAFAGNPYVWFGTFNEPGTQGGSVSGWELATYNAIRGAGNNSPILLEIVGWPGAWNNSMTPSDFAGMHNTIWDPHFYGWVARYSTDQASVDQALADEIAGVQQIPSADGKMPVIIAEYGNATDGTNIDPNGVQVVTSVVNAGGSGKAGSAAWAWLPGGNADHLQDGGTLTSPYGQQVALYIGLTTQTCTAAEATANANNEIAAVTAAIDAPPPASAAPASAQPAASSSPAAADPTTDTLNQAADASIAQANAIIAAAQAQMQPAPAATP
jgi:Cellulase (glycosyl hydrolase family 5)